MRFPERYKYVMCWSGMSVTMSIGTAAMVILFTAGLSLTCDERVEDSLDQLASAGNFTFPPANTTADQLATVGNFTFPPANTTISKMADEYCAKGNDSWVFQFLNNTLVLGKFKESMAVARVVKDIEIWGGGILIVAFTLFSIYSAYRLVGAWKDTRDEGYNPLNPVQGLELGAGLDNAIQMNEFAT